MADSNNFSDINDNFDTIKTLLNSIRAQGILNTSDMDKLLEGINSKLEKINTEEDIDLIKAFLSELKKNLDERHEVLISKFGAIESLFSNLLKNSNDSAKSGELKELFDIIATNLSVFSREVVSQKETLTDITLRLDAMRSDDTQKKDIIKSVSSVRNDIEKVNNAFDSIVISLNENFKTVLKTVSEIDQSEAIKGFASQLTDILNSSNTILSAIQLIDKKNTSFEDSFERLVTQDDISSLQKALVELSAKSEELVNLVDILTQKSYKIDNLADKIDASVNIIAGLKAEIADKDSETKTSILERLSQLETVVRDVSTDAEFEEFKHSLENVLKDIFNSSEQLKGSLESALNNISKLNDDLRALDINTNFHDLSNGVLRVGEDIKEKVITESDKMSQIMDVNLTRTLNEISSTSDIINTRLKDAHSKISEICERNFAEVSNGISGLKDVVAQLDENNVSANNAIFSNITDRLAIFENSLKTSLEKQEDFVSGSSSGIFEQIKNMKSVAEGIDYKLDANAIEFGNTKRELDELTDSINKVLALDFVNVVRDFKVDLYAIKQDLTNTAESAQTELSENITKDLFGKYELLVSKLDNVEDEMKFTQANTLNSLQTLLGNISSSLVDVLSYVSTAKDDNSETIEAKLSEVTTFIQDSNLNYIENVRDIVDVIRAQVENNLRQISEESDGRFSRITVSISESNKSIREDINTAYNKIVEVQGHVESLNNSINSNSDTLSANVSTIIESTESLKGDFDYKLNSLKNSLLDMVTEFKKDFTCENADKISELKFNAENLNAQAQQQSIELKNELRDELAGIIDKLKLNISSLSELVSGTSLKIEGANKEVIDFVRNDFTNEVNNSVESIKTNTAEVLTEIDNKVTDVVNGVETLESSVNNLSAETTHALSGTLAKILDNFVSLSSALNSFDEKNSEKFRETVEDIREDFNSVKKKISEVDSQIDEDLAHQISIIEGSFESLNLMLVDIMNQATDSLGDKIKSELSGVSIQMKDSLSEELEQYKIQIEELFEGLQGKNNEQAEFIKGCVLELNNVLEATLTHQGKDAAMQLEDVSKNLKEMLNESIELTSADYETLKTKLNDFVDRVERHNNVLVDTIKSQLDDITKYIDSNLDIQAQEVNASFEEISSSIQKVVSTIRDFNSEWGTKISELKTSFEDLKEESLYKTDEKSAEIIEKIGLVIDSISGESDSSLFVKINSIKTVVENYANGTQSKVGLKAQEIVDELALMQSSFVEQNNRIKEILDSDIKPKFTELDSKLAVLLEDNILKLSANIGDSETHLSENITNGVNELRTSINNLTEKYDKDELSRLDIQQALIAELNENFNDVIAEFKEDVKNDISSISGLLNVNSKEACESIDKSLQEKANAILGKVEIVNQNNRDSYEIMGKSLDESTASIIEKIDLINQNNNDSIEKIGKDLQDRENAITHHIDIVDQNSKYNFEKLDRTLAESLDSIIEQIENTKQNTLVCRDLISNLVKEHSDIISHNIEKETDVIVADIIEQASIIKDSQKDELSAMASSLEGSVSGYIIDGINDLKSYLDIKTDSSVMDGKLDALRTELTKSIDDTSENINKLLEVSVFTDAITDLRTTNQVLLETMAEKVNSQIKDFVRENVSNKIDEKVSYLDKKVIETIVDKYEEIKVLSMEHNKVFDKISNSVSDILSKFVDSKDEINANIKTLLSGVNKSVDDLRASFADLRSQILNKSFDEAFHASVHNQISGIENLVKEQMGYIEDISDLCCSNLPELSEMNTIVKHGIVQSISNIQEQINSRGREVSNEFNTIKDSISNQEGYIKQELNALKTDIVTQFINVFNQISFVAEQEEIIDFIQEKHSELITILSHIVTTVDEVETVKDNLAVVDNKIDTLKEDIDLINEKITSIMSSEGDIDYVYSLQDLESDIANLRLVLNEMKSDNKSKEFEELISSTNNIYQIVEIIKSELPKFEAEEFKKDFNNLAEDIVSISTRTNKLILTSDESYKTLQDNLQDFKLVIDDLDERTKNFAHESGIDKLDHKLASINTMIQNGARTNQVFNQVFEYLAEWVDRAGEQITTISDKVDTLDDIGQIKVMLEDLRAEANDNSYAEEIVSSIENVFEKQAKKISSLEAKLDKIIVASNINSKKLNTDIKPIEDTLNKFLTSLEDKILSQQDKINSLEMKLEEFVSLVDNKDTAQLTKKVGGMDRQLAKLNKSIEKIASNVVEK